MDVVCMCFPLAFENKKILPSVLSAGLLCFCFLDLFTNTSTQNLTENLSAFNHTSSFTLYFLLLSSADQDHHGALKILVHRAVFSMMMDLALKAVQVYMDRSIHFVHASIVIMISRIVKLIRFLAAPI